MGEHPDRELWARIGRYYLDLVASPDPGFEQILTKLHAAGLPPLWISPSLGSFLQLLVASLNARRVLEIGTQGGFSTAWLAKGLPADGYLVSLEIRPENAALAVENLSGFDFFRQIEFLVGDALLALQEMIDAGDPPFDFIFIDAEKAHYTAYLDLSLQLSRKGTVIVADNVVKHGRIVNEAIQMPSQIGITEFHQKVAADPRIQAAVLQTVDEKGHDGITYMVIDPGAEQQTVIRPIRR